MTKDNINKLIQGGGAGLGSLFELFQKRPQYAQRPGYLKDNTELFNYLKAQGEENPADTENRYMAQYSSSPEASYLKDQALQAANNVAGAKGDAGSPAEQEAYQKQAAGIAQGDLQDYMGRVNSLRGQNNASMSSLLANNQNLAQHFNDMEFKNKMDAFNARGKAEGDILSGAADIAGAFV